jgi:hypothetical protein
MSWQSWLFLALFFVSVIVFAVSIERPGLLIRWGGTKARFIGLLSVGLVAILFLALFMQSTFEPISNDEIKDMVRSSPHVLKREMAAQNLAAQLDPKMASWVSGLAERSAKASESLEVMRVSYCDMYADGSASRREDVVACMCEICDEEAVGFIERALMEDKSEMVRERAAISLGEMGSHDSCPVLIESLLAEEEGSGLIETTQMVLSDFKEASAGFLVEKRCAMGQGEANTARLEEVLVEIGEPAIYPVLNLFGSANSYWAEEVIYQMGSVTKEYLRGKMNNQNQDFNIRCATAIPLLRMEEQRDQQRIGTLIYYCRNRDWNNIALHVSNNYEQFVRLGISGTEYFLIDALNAHGNIPMAEVYLNCGSAKLDQAARAWVGRRSNLYISEGTGTYEGPRWGG